MIKRKAITPIIAIVLILMMTVAVFALVFIWLIATQDDLQESVSSDIKIVQEKVSSCLSIEQTYGDILYVRNCGDGVVENTSLTLYVDGKPAKHSMSPASLSDGSLGVLKIDPYENITYKKQDIRLKGDKGISAVKTAKFGNIYEFKYVFLPSFSINAFSLPIEPENTSIYFVFPPSEFTVDDEVSERKINGQYKLTRLYANSLWWSVDGQTFITPNQGYWMKNTAPSNNYHSIKGKKVQNINIPLFQYIGATSTNETFIGWHSLKEKPVEQALQSISGKWNHIVEKSASGDLMYSETQKEFKNLEPGKAYVLYINDTSCTVASPCYLTYDWEFNEEYW